MRDACSANPELMIPLAGLITALVAPTHGAGGIGLAIVIASTGAIVARHTHRMPRVIRRPPIGIARLLALALVATACVVTFWDQGEARSWVLGDYAGQHAALKQLVPALREGHIPTWSMGISTGEAPFETYPALTYVIAALAALAAGMEDRLVDVLVIVAIVAHATIALNVARLVARIAPAWIAAVLGMLLVVDAGSISAGGVVGAIEWGLVHNAVGQAFTMFAIVAVVDALARPSLGRSLTIWIATALATATHPAALLATAGGMLALVLVALLARDVPPRRAIAAIGHLGLGALLGAVVWLPLGERMLQYGQHFSAGIRTPARILEELLAAPFPPSTFAAVVFAGYVGLVLALWSRRAQPVFVGAAGIVMLVGFIDTPYLLTDTAPGQAVARLGTDRFLALARPFVFAAAGYLAAIALAHVHARWRTAPPAQRSIAGALLALALALLVRAVVPLSGELSQRAHDLSYRAANPDGQGALVAWAKQQVAAMSPDRYGRAMFELGGAHYHFHLTAETGLPSFHMGPLPDLLLRERIEDTSPESLRRFNVRWIIERDKAPSMGEPATELQLGSYRIRELPTWDGLFARIERGTGTVATRVLEDERVQIELTGTDQPALVALGMGYYPRWRAVDAAGNAIRTYAYPTRPGGQLHVLAAWVPPGITTFYADGPLPSDGKGLPYAVGALVIACAGIVIWSRRRWRVRALRAIARSLARARAHRRALRIATTSIVALALLAWGLVGRVQPVKVLEVGRGLRGVATVRARHPGEPWQACSFRRMRGAYRCEGLATVHDAIDHVINDAQPLWPYTTPVIRVVGDPGEVVEVEIAIEARLAGSYWVGSTGRYLRVQVGKDPFFETQRQHALALPDRGRIRVIISGYATTSGTSLAFVREDTLHPARPFLAPPPETPPAHLAP